jgi:cysteine-rich repeat protein
MRILALTILAACGSEPAEPDEPAPMCGDGVTDPGEACDDGNATNGDGCGALCTSEVLFDVSWVFYPVLGQPAGPCRANVTNVEIHVDNGVTRVFPCGPGHDKMFLPRDPRFRAFARAVDAQGVTVVESTPHSGSYFELYEDAGFIRAFLNLQECRITPPTLFEVIDSTGTKDVLGYVCEGDNLDVMHDGLISRPQRPGTYDVHVVTFDREYLQQGVVVGANNTIADVDFTAP